MIAVAQFLKRFYWPRGLAVVGALTAIWVASPRGASAQKVQRLRLTTCPINWSSILPHGLLVDSIGGELVLPGATTNIPEFNDCQRFIDSTGQNYLSIFGIFGSWDFSRHFAVFTGRKPAGQGTSSLAPTGFVEIVSDGSYGPLGIGPGFSCVYLYGPDTLRLRAQMVTASTESACAQQRSLDQLRGTELQVRRWQHATHKADADYPPAARWEWDSRHKVHYLGAKCGAGWCEVGPKGFQPDPPLPVASSGRVFRINGWFDRQQLAAVPPGPQASAGSGNAQKPDPGWGTVFPDPKLIDYYLANGDFTARWRLSAHVALDRSLTAYERKLNFTPVPVHAARLNEVYLCWGLWEACRAAALADSSQFYRRDVKPGVRQVTSVPIPGLGRQLPQPTCGTPDSTGVRREDKGRWWAAVISAKGAVAFRCVVRCDHAAEFQKIGMNGHLGTARWWWTPEDETIWVSCDAGCCRVRPG